MSETKKLVCQKWEESERGWGRRPDGYSLHLTDRNRRAFIDDYWSRMPDEVPDEYSCPDGTPYLVEVDRETYDLVNATKNGQRFFRTAPKGGVDGWMSLGEGVHEAKGNPVSTAFAAYKDYAFEAGKKA